MNEYYTDGITPETPNTEDAVSEHNTQNYEDISSVSESDAQNFEGISSTSEDAKNENSAEGSYEWNAEPTPTGSEYHYSYVNGNNRTAAHNPNNYDSAPQQNSYTDYSRTTPYNYQNTSQRANHYSSTGYNGAHSYNSPYNGYSSAPNYGNTNQWQNSQQTAARPVKKKKEKKPASRGFIAAMLVLTMICSAALGFGGGYIAKNMNTTTSGNLTINQVSPSDRETNASTVSASTTSNIVKKTADSVVEIVTESVKTGTFARQYVTTGAGSGVIISADGYIVTNHHVIEGANSITVTLRDATTTYDATLIGSDEDNDIALIKINAEGLTPATFGDSSTLAVGDYVVAIGNPLGTLGGTVTDGIISALAREVTIEDKNMTLLQTNAQISPGNSGGGLFNANGELIGIVNAKSTATEVEGIAFAIPVNNVLDIIKDLQNYGYVTGKIDLGIEFVDINSNDTAFYYGVNQLGCYVLSVELGSNADIAGVRRGDLITKVNGEEVSSSSDISSALTDSKVGDSVTLTVTRSGQTSDISFTLSEYVPSAKLSQDYTDNSDNYYSGDDFWNRIFGW